MRTFMILCGVLLTGTWCLGQNDESIRATVLDANDQPVSGAIVQARPLDGVSAMVLPWCRTDGTGTCTISPLQHLRYLVSSSKAEDGYPEQDVTFYVLPGTAPAIVTLSAEQPAATVLLHLGKQGGVLVGTVADAVTGKPLNANVTFRWVSDPDRFMSGSGLTNAKFRIMVPSDTPVTMVVSLNGYQDWTYTLGRGELWNALLLRPGEVLTLDIRLQPKE